MPDTCASHPLERELDLGDERFRYIALADMDRIERVPISLRILIENVLRCSADPVEGMSLANSIIDAALAGAPGGEMSFMPSRVLFQDFTGVPVFCDFAAMRDAAQGLGADPALVNPQIPCVLVIDHSVTADVTSCHRAAAENERIEARRNAERFAFLKWSSESFDNVRIVPPGTGICHQLNIERFCDVVSASGADPRRWVHFDTLVGTDSHTTTANGIGVLGWGVGGIEAEAAALGQPITMTVPSVVGLRLIGQLPAGAGAMDAALGIAELLRGAGVVGSIVECFGEGARSLSVTQRSTIANMSPEYGCTATFFPPDEAALGQLAVFGREGRSVELARRYLEVQGILGYAPESCVYERVLEFDLSRVTRSLAGPSRPHDRLGPANLRDVFRTALTRRGRRPGERFGIDVDGSAVEVGHGAIAIAAVTSCTTATDPEMMVEAGLVARRAIELGCAVPPWVKCVFAPGSHATTDLMRRAGLLEPLGALGFAVCGWGCMSCIGNSGPIVPGLRAVSDRCELASVLSGNRNFEGRISPDVMQNYLCAPALVVAYALAGTVDIDLEHEAVCSGATGPVALADLLPRPGEVERVLAGIDLADVYAFSARSLFRGSDSWTGIEAVATPTFAWDAESTYVRRPPFLDAAADAPVGGVDGARALVVLGDFVTTDHISPAGAIAADSPAGRYLAERGVRPEDFNSYGSRRGNHEVMMRGTFANPRLSCPLAPGREGGWTRDPVSGQEATVFDAARSAREAGIPLLVIAGKMYGSGSSRDWAAKGPALLGVRAVIAESFERIHRSNLVGMGILPLEFACGESAGTLGITGEETFDISAPAPRSDPSRPPLATVTATRPDGSRFSFDVAVRIDTEREAAYLSQGGILPYVLSRLVS